MAQNRQRDQYHKGENQMNTPVIFFCGVLAALLAAVLVFAGIYFTRIQTLNSIEKLTGYADGFNLYRMDVRYSYSLDDMISYGVRDNQTMINVISKAALPFFPVKIQAPEFGCTAFTLTDRNGAVHMGRNYDFRNNTSAMLVCCTPENGYKSVAYAALDNVSANVPEESIKKKLASLTAPFACLDGMNEKGVSIAVLIVDSEPVHQNTGKPVIFTSLAVRLVLDRAATTQEAVDLLRGYDMFSAGGRDYHFYITDAKGDGRILEYDCESEVRTLVATPVSAATNFYALYQEKVLPNQRNSIYGHGRERYDAVLDVFRQQEGNYTDDTVWAALRAASQDPEPESVTSNTQWSVAYNNTDLTSDIVIRRNWKDITHYDLKENKERR